jgi:hypothetical protein
VWRSRLLFLAKQARKQGVLKYFWSTDVRIFDRLPDTDIGEEGEVQQIKSENYFVYLGANLSAELHANTGESQGPEAPAGDDVGE